MPSYHTFTTTRTTPPDLAAVITSLRATVDPSAGVSWPSGGPAVMVKIAAAVWTPAQVAAAQTAIDTAPDFDPASSDVDQKVLKAIVLGIWEAIPNPTLTKAQLRARIVAIWKGLP
jgi:hypothetical protein